MKIDTKKFPEKPGIYLFKDKTGKILYIGKARILHNRVRSYFQKNTSLSVTKQMMVRQIRNVETIVTNTENEALLLEANLIKRHQPPYNIALKDGKKFLYIKITVKEMFPRVFTTRTISKDHARYFGPYTSAGYVRYILRILKRLFPHRNFEKAPSKEQLTRLTKRYPELFGPTDAKQYTENIQNILHFLEGKFTLISRLLKKRMVAASEAEQYETAASFRDHLEAVKRITERQQVVSTKKESYDLLGLARNNDLAVISLLFIREGKLVGKEDFTLMRTRDESDEMIVRVFLEQYYPTSPEHIKHLYLPHTMKKLSDLSKLISLNLHIAKRGAKRHLITMATTNAREYLSRTVSQEEKREEQGKTALKELQKVIQAPQLPKRIECYDISNIQGTHAVGSMVVFTDGIPSKNDYRKFKIKSIQGANDPAMMAEVLDRRFGQKNDSKWKHPDLIILDGGKGQLSVVQRKLGKRIQKVPIIALAKREEELYLPGIKQPCALPTGSAGYHLIQRIRDEAHRFAIGYYRKRHEKSLTASTLDEIPGIGTKTRMKLLSTFGSIERISQAPLKKLAQIVGTKKARQLKKELL
ncbi:excinuclease ABC subunit UvrC [Patescibacteria group bacterium]